MTVTAPHPIRTVDLYWAAGFLVGEGSFQAKSQKTRPGFQFRVQATQVEEAPLRALHRLFGGSLYHFERVRGEGHYPIWTWQVCSSSAVRVMMTLATIIRDISPRRFVQIKECVALWRKQGRGSSQCRRGHTRNVDQRGRCLTCRRARRAT